jgi:hypothetical protein
MNINDKNTREVIRDLLIKFPHLRDSDEKLIATVWNTESKGIENKYDFLFALSQGNYTSPETIMRIRRKLQEEYHPLRGLNYEKRQAYTKKVKKDLGYTVQ